MNKTIQTNLCKGLRACGIRKQESNQILDIVLKWYHENGPEWTNSRIKDLRQWYETYLTGNPVPPPWFKHSTEGLPTGIWGRVFKLKPAKALGVLSLNTVFYEDQLSETQKNKFLHGLTGNRNQNPDYISEVSNLHVNVRLPKDMPGIKFPTVFDMTGSIPVNDCRSSIRPEQKLGMALKALRSSWESVPQVTFDFLVNQDLLGYMPVDTLGNDYQIELDRPHDRCVGRVSVLQQPQLKARIVGNPNRILQVTLEPLKQVYMTCARNLPTDVTFDQESGVRWVQDKLKQGIELAGSDLTSASDLLDVGLSLKLVNSVYQFPKINGYQAYEQYFFDVSRSKWYCPALRSEVQWEQGDVLGTGPSFGLLTLTNNAAAAIAYSQARKDQVISRDIALDDSFRVVGDDIVMRSEMEPYYSKVIDALGGEINHSKTLKSDRVAEFAGRVITKDSCYLKAIKYSEPSDNSFMSFMSQLGDQAKSLLLPKQRQVYNLLKEVPGVVVPGPWMPDSYGIGLSDRYQWYLEEVLPALFAVEPDLDPISYAMLLLKAHLSLEEADQNNSKAQYDEPTIDEGYLPSQVTPTFKVGGDPRLTNGKSQLDVLYQHIPEKDILSFEEWKRDQSTVTLTGAEDQTSYSSLDDYLARNSEPTQNDNESSLSLTDMYHRQTGKTTSYQNEASDTEAHRSLESAFEMDIDSSEESLDLS